VAKEKSMQLRHVGRRSWILYVLRVDLVTVWKTPY
jgi:hypothetical protein